MYELKESNDLHWWWPKPQHHHWMDINKIYKINDRNVNEIDATRASPTTTTTIKPGWNDNKLVFNWRMHECNNNSW